MYHFGLGFFVGLLVWLAILITCNMHGWGFPGGRGYLFNALAFGFIGGIAGVAVDIDYLLHMWLGLPYRFWHIPALILGSILSIACIYYLYQKLPGGKWCYLCSLVLVATLSITTHVLEDYLLGWF